MMVMSILGDAMERCAEALKGLNCRLKSLGSAYCIAGEKKNPGFLIKEIKPRDRQVNNHL